MTFLTPREISHARSRYLTRRLRFLSREINQGRAVSFLTVRFLTHDNSHVWVRFLTRGQGISPMKLLTAMTAQHQPVISTRTRPLSLYSHSRSHISICTCLRQYMHACVISICMPASSVYACLVACLLIGDTISQSSRVIMHHRHKSRGRATQSVGTPGAHLWELRGAVSRVRWGWIW